MTVTRHRSLIVSLDGATWSVLRPLLSSDKIPTLSRLEKSSFRGNLESVLPPITAAAWFSFQTGKVPAHHGVSTFKHVENDGRTITTVDATTNVEPTLWHYLEASGLSSIKVNVPGTYPATSLPSKTISGILAPSYEDDAAVNPKEIRDLVKEVYDEYAILTNPRDTYDPHVNTEKFIAAMKDNVRSRSTVTHRLMREYDDWDVTMMHIQATDVLQHPLWKHLDTEHPAFEEEIYELLIGFYQTLDAEIGEVIEHARNQSESLDIYVISDHGFQGLKTQVYMDRVLKELGFLIDSNTSLETRIKSGILRFIQKADLLNLRKTLLAKERRVSLGHSMNTSGIDWDRSIAWGHGNLYGYVYLLDNSKKEEVIKAIAGFNENLIRDVVDVEELYNNVHTDAPDLFVIPKESVTIDTLNEPDGPIWREIDYHSTFHVGGHHKEGIILLNGPGVTEKATSSATHLTDIMPTILHRHNLGVPNDLDGSVLFDAFDDPGDLTTIAPIERSIVESSRGELRSEVEERLRNLGYKE